MNLDDMLSAVIGGKDKHEKTNDEKRERKVVKSIRATPDQIRRRKEYLNGMNDLRADVAKKAAEVYAKFNALNHIRDAFWVDVEREHQAFGDMHFNDEKQTIEILESPFALLDETDKKGGAYKKLRALLSDSD